VVVLLEALQTRAPDAPALTRTHRADSQQVIAEG
jgi:hypothetical protein